MNYNEPNKQCIIIIIIIIIIRTPGRHYMCIQQMAALSCVKWRHGRYL